MKSRSDTLLGLILVVSSLVFVQNLRAGPQLTPDKTTAPFGNQIRTENKTGYKNKTWTERMENRFGGQLTLEGNATGYDAGSYFDPVGTHTGTDGLVLVRLTDTLIVSEHIYFEAHYEAFARSGDTYKKQAAIQKYVPSPARDLISDSLNIDRRRLFNLTRTLEETDDHILWHRFDRLFFSIKPSWGDILFGRQAITWGNGFIFNPMDIFNPFAPSDVVRDYKMGDDLMSLRLNTDLFGECNLIYVPRRDIVTNDIDFNESSVAGKFHVFAGSREMDIMGAWHYGEIVFGLGETGIFKDAAWRTDFVWSTLEKGKDLNGYFQFVANMDYSWIWFGKNMYGLVEYYHNSLGKHNYTKALADPESLERIDRGELFVLGKNYVSALLQMELTPLLNVYLNVISNVRDPSAMIQPRMILSMTQNSTLHFGASLFYGKKQSEFGGFLIPGTPYYTNAALNAYLRFTYYF